MDVATIVNCYLNIGVCIYATPRVPNLPTAISLNRSEYFYYIPSNAPKIFDVPASNNGAVRDSV